MCADGGGEAQTQWDAPSLIKYHRVAAWTPLCLSTERISEASFGFSAASPVSRHEACGLPPLQLVQIPQGKVKGPLDRARGHLADSLVALIYVFI